METFCVHCDHRIELGARVRAGNRVTCPACGAHLEVINLGPLELDWAYDEPYGENWDPPMGSAASAAREVLLHP